MEEAFDTGFKDVRIHDGPAAHTSTVELGAEAFAVGPHIAMRQGTFAPSTSMGRRLLSHELAHVVQQRASGPSTGRAEADADRAARDVLEGRSVTDPGSSGPGPHFQERPGQEPSGVTFWFSVRVTEEMDSDDLLVRFIQQYLGIEDRGAAERAITDAQWRWVGAPKIADAAAVRRGYVLVRVRDRSITPTTPEERQQIRSSLDSMGEAEGSALSTEVDRRFWSRTHYRRGEALGSSADDRRMARYWIQLRDNLVRARMDLLALPEHVRDVLFDPQAARHLEPRDYEIALRVGRTLAAMSAAELADWQARTNEMTDDWATFEASISAYQQEQADRRQEQLELGGLRTRLYGLEGLYRLRDQVKGAEILADLPSTDGMGPRDQNVIDARVRLPGLRQELATALRQNGFANLAEFDAAMAAWRHGFERESVRIADVMLDRLDHVLAEQQRRYAAEPARTRLFDDVRGSGAAGRYRVAEEEADRSVRLSSPSNAMTETPIDEAGSLDAASRSAQARGEGEDAIRSLAPSHPLLAFPDFPREALARASAEEAATIMRDFISEQRDSVRDTRAQLHGDHDLVYRYDALFAASKREQGVEPNTIYASILDEYVSDRALAKILTGIAVAILAIALSIVTLGGGAVGAAAGVAAFGLSAWQAVDAFNEYVRDSNAADAQLLSEDPTIAWLVLAVVGAAADFGGAVAAVRAIRPAAVTLNAALAAGEPGAIEAFRATVAAKRLEEAAVTARIAEAVERSAQAQRGLAAQWRAVTAIATRVNDITGVIAEGGARLMVIAWFGARRGLIRFEQFLLELQRARVIADIEHLTQAELTALKAPFQEALQRAAQGFLDRSALSPALRASAPAQTLDEAAAVGRLFGLTDQEVIEVLEAQARLPRQAGAGAMSEDALRQAMFERAEALGRGSAAVDAPTAPATGAGSSGQSGVGTGQTGAGTGQTGTGNVQNPAAGTAQTVLPPQRAQLPATRVRSDTLVLDGRVSNSGMIDTLSGTRRADGSLTVTIEGRVGPGLGQRLDYEKDLLGGTQVGLPGYERAHLWGQSLGDEAAEGIAYAPREVNQIFQNQKMEEFLREMRDLASSRGGTVRLRAHLETHPPGLHPRGVTEPGADRIVRRLDYEFEIVENGRVTQTNRVTINVGPPPNGSVGVELSGPQLTPN